ncbi:regucalcin-like [Mercenaria mercenaria]|uniref:regucalcin-like n=1 Tax=Mercenaria mercenaria TaxID=6596 RepID=UPI00234E5D91|nr:regucalcin-like [Mercenaria mercenaria]XP_045157473.2 regucalcin-like [Mercenaria mercenaria]
MSAKVETLIECSCVSVGEGPHWDGESHTLLYVDIIDGSLHRWSATTGLDEKHTFDTFCSLVVPCRKGGYLISLGKSICHFDWDTKKVIILHTVDEGLDTRINDGKCDASGRLWFGTMTMQNAQGERELYKGSLYSLEVDGTVRKHKGEITVSNGLAWSADNRTMYYIDSHPRKVFAYDFDLSSGTLSNARVAIDFDDETKQLEGFPDGMTIDVNGKLWVACFHGGKVVQLDPVTGNTITSIEVPVNRPTSCCFGGTNYDDLFITCSRYSLPEEELKQTPLAGSVFRATGLGTKGTPAPLYEGIINKASGPDCRI